MITKKEFFETCFFFGCLYILICMLIMFAMIFG